MMAASLQLFSACLNTRTESSWTNQILFHAVFIFGEAEAGLKVLEWHTKGLEQVALW